MKWIIPTGHYFYNNQRLPFRHAGCMSTEDGRFTISRSPHDGFVRPGETIVYMLTERPSGGFAPVPPDNTRVIERVRGVVDTPETRLAAINHLKSVAGDIDV